MNLLLFGVTYYFKLPLLPYHTGTLYVSVMLGTAAGILCTTVTFLGISLFCYGTDFIWFTISGILIATIIGGQFKKETRPINWLIAAGEVFLCDLFFYILFTLWKHDGIPYDYCGQRIFMFFYEQDMEEVFAVCMAATSVVVLSSIQSVITAVLAVVCTPKKWLFPTENVSEQKSLKSKQQEN